MSNERNDNENKSPKAEAPNDKKPKLETDPTIKEDKHHKKPSHSVHYLTKDTIIISELYDSDQSDSSQSTTPPTIADEKYLVEEPFDYIFEPHHNKPTTESTQTTKKQNENEIIAGFDPVYESKGKTNYDRSTNTTVSTFTSRAAKMLGEKDGIVEYEYVSRQSSSRFRQRMNSEAINDDDDTEMEMLENFFDEFDLKHHHLNAITRGISLSRFASGPSFGFKLSRSVSFDDDFIYISQIEPDSPAEFCLQIGDVIVELDEMDPCESFSNLSEINRYLSERDFIHLMAIHASKYSMLKSQNDLNLLRDHCYNCEDIVIVSFKEKGDQSA
jgi:hypothetical protein